jgi:hypothetical protein
VQAAAEELRAAPGQGPYLERYLESY